MRLGIDLGGTKTEIIALDESGEVLIRERAPTPRNSYQAILANIKTLVDKTETELGETGTVGFATPGAISSVTGLIKNSNTTCYNGKPLQKDLENLLNREVRLSNDANCFALSEATDGASKDASTVLAVILGTGTGAGIVVNKQILLGANNIAGEYGHNPLPWPTTDELPGPACYCGKQGCIETFLSGPSMAKHFYQRTNMKITAKAIAKLADEYHIDCLRELEIYERRLAKSLAHVINILDPDVIVLGGGISNIKRLYKNVPKLWLDYVFSDHCATKLLPPKYGDSSGVRGAAWLW